MAAADMDTAAGLKRGRPSTPPGMPSTTGKGRGSAEAAGIYVEILHVLILPLISYVFHYIPALQSGSSRYSALK